MRRLRAPRGRPLRGFSGARRLGIGGRIDRSAAHAAKAGAALAPYLLRGLARPGRLRRPRSAGPSCAQLAPVEPSVAGVAVLSLMLFATIVASFILSGEGRRRRSASLRPKSRGRAPTHRASLMLHSDSQILISWDRPDAEPTIEGDFALVADSPQPSGVLGFCSARAGRRGQSAKRRSGSWTAAKPLPPPRLACGRHSRSTDAPSPAAR